MCKVSAAPQRKQLYLDKAESRLQAPYSNSQAASRKGDRGAPDSGVCRAVRAAVRTDGAGCPALTDALLRRAGAALPDSAAGRLHAQPDTAASRGGACQPRAHLHYSSHHPAVRSSEGVPVLGRAGTRWSLVSLPTQTTL